MTKVQHFCGNCGKTLPLLKDRKRKDNLCSAKCKRADDKFYKSFRIAKPIDDIEGRT